MGESALNPFSRGIPEIHEYCVDTYIYIYTHNQSSVRMREYLECGIGPSPTRT